MNSMKKRPLIALTLFLTLLTPMLFPRMAYADTPRSVSYVALGDSLAAGQDPYGHEKGFGYTQVINIFLRMTYSRSRYSNFGVSGMTSEILLDQLDPSDGDCNREMVKRLKSVGDGIVTIDIGGNDLWPLIVDLYIPTFNSDVNTTEAMVIAAFNEFSTNLPQILQAIRGYSEDADIFIMGYYNAFMNLVKLVDPTGDLGYNEKVEDYLDQLNGIISGYASLYGVNYVETDGVIKPFMLPKDIHPNITGYIAIGAEFIKAIKEVREIE